MKKIRLTEAALRSVVKKIIKENEGLGGAPDLYEIANAIVAGTPYKVEYDVYPQIPLAGGLVLTPSDDAGDREGLVLAVHGGDEFGSGWDEEIVDVSDEPMDVVIATGKNLIRKWENVDVSSSPGAKKYSRAYRG